MTTRDWIDEALRRERPPMRAAGWPTHRRRARVRKRRAAAQARHRARARRHAPDIREPSWPT